MKVQRFSLLLGLISLTGSGLLIAQTSPAPTSPSSQTQPSQPDSQTPSDNPSAAPQSSTDSTTSGGDSTHAAMKRCVAQLRAQNPSASDQAIIQACQSQIGGGSTPKQ
jgi:hypothetical protein